MILEIIGTGIAVLILHHLLTKPKPFHINVPPIQMVVAGINLYPLFRQLYFLFPDKTRKNLLVKQNAPGKKQICDLFDMEGESPYEVSELKDGKVWKVTYTYENDVADKGTYGKTKILGMDFMSNEFQEKVLKAAEKYDDEVVTIAKQDIETVRTWLPKLHSGDFNNMPKELRYATLNMFIVKLNSGSLLLYAPITIRDVVKGFADWLDSLGKVEWVVVGAASHTLHLKSIIERYPSASVIGPVYAQEKVKQIMKLPREDFDFQSTDKHSLEEANLILKDEGCTIYNVDGDGNDAIVVKVDDVLLECDLTYGHHDYEGFATMDKEAFRKGDVSTLYARLFKFGLLDSSVNKMLPNYRFWLMDPNNLACMTYDFMQAIDGESCKVMAESLRKIMQLDFQLVAGAHLHGMSGEDWRKTMELTWNWLDGESLLQ